jgi:hypothetical protein
MIAVACLMALRLSYPSNFSLKFAPDSIHYGGGQYDWGRVPKLGDWSWESHIRRITSKTASMNRHFRVTNLPTTFCRRLRRMPGFERMNRRFGVTNMPTAFCLCLRRMHGFEGLWSSYRTSYSETSLIEGSATSLPRP